MKNCIWMVLFLVMVALHSIGAAQDAPKPPATPPVEKLGENRFRIGTIEVDTAKREIRVPGKVTTAMGLEFVASTKGGFKTYESALEMDTDAVTFNLAMILIGFDQSKGVPTRYHFDSNPPKGDPVEIWVHWKSKTSGNEMGVKAEELIWNRHIEKPMPAGEWVYTGSVVLNDGRYLADLDGVLIGFVHTPAPIIERSTFERTSYGTLTLNPKWKLAPQQPVTMVIKAAKRNPLPRKPR